MSTPPPYEGARGGGLGIQYFDEKKNMQQGDKNSWEPTQPPASHYVPYREFQDVELNRAPTYASSRSNRTEKHYEPPQYYSTRPASRATGWFWILYLFIFLVFFVGVPLAIFGGVYRWNYGQYRCSRSWGVWHQDTQSCTY